jgi:hypothetical protein
MKTLAAALAATLLATPVLAQATPPAAGSSPSPSDNQSATTSRDAGFGNTARSGRGAYIKLEGPQGGEITIRCADGETTRACADIAMQLMDRARSMGSDNRRDTRGGDYYRDRDRGRDY